MISRRPLRLLRVALISIAAACVVLGIVLFAGPKLAGVPAIKTQIERKASAFVQGRVTWEALEMRVLPYPSAVFRRAAIDIPGVITGRAEEITIDLRLLPLLRGHAEVASVHVRRPVLNVVIGSGSAAQSTANTDPIAAYRSAMEPLAQALRSAAPNTVLVIEEGIVNLRAADLPELQLTKLSLRAITARDAATVALSSESNFWSRLQLDAHLGLSDLQGKAVLDVSELKPQSMLDRMVPAPMAIAFPAGNVHVEAHTDGRSNLQGSFSVDAASLGLARGARRLDVADAVIKGGVLVDAQHKEIMLSEVRLGNLLTAGTVSLRLQNAGPVEADVALPVLDLVKLRDAALAIGGDQEVVRQYASRLHAGTVSDLALKGKAEALEALFQLESLGGSLTLKDAAALVPYVEREVAGVNGMLSLSDGHLKAQSVSGRMGELRVADGAVDLALLSGDIAVVSNIDVDLAQTLNVVRSLLPKGARESIAEIRSITGRGKGSGRFAYKGKRWDAEILVAQSDSRMQTDWLPWPMTVKEGRISFSADQLSFSGVRGSIGDSAISDAAAQLSYSGPFRIDRASGQITVALGELYPWLRSQAGLAHALEPVKSIIGSAQVRLNQLSGRPDQPDKLNYDAVVEPRSVTMEVEDLGGPVTVAGGSVGINPSAITLDAVGATLLDAQAKLSGRLNGYRSKAWAIDGKAAEGAMGEKLVRWIWRTAKVPRRFLPNTPLRFNVQRLRWNAQQQLDTQATAQFEGGTTVAANLSWVAGDLDIREISVKDENSDATIALKVRGQTLDARFKGKLVGKTVVGILKRSANHPGRMSGDLHVVIDRDHPELTYGNGNLTGTNWDFNWLLHLPLKVDRIVLTADRSQTRIEEAAVSWADQMATITGKIDHTSTGPVVDAHIDSPGIVVAALFPASGPEGEVEDSSEWFGSQTISWLWPMLVTGRVSVHADQLQYKHYKIEPVEGTLALEREHAHLVVQNAQLCGVSFPFTMDATPEGISAAAQLSAQNQGIQKTARCLTNERVLLSGRFDMEARLTTHGTDEATFLSNLIGSAALQARNGKVMKMPLLGNILQLKSIAGTFKRGPPKLNDEGFPYNNLVVAGHIEKGRFFVDQGTFDSDAMGLVASGSVSLDGKDTKLTVLFALFGGLDRLVRKIPLIGYVIGGALTSIPIAVKGDIRDPEVVPLGARAVGTELLGIFERALKLPVKVFDPEAMAPGLK